MRGPVNRAGKRGWAGGCFPAGSQGRPVSGCLPMSDQSERSRPLQPVGKYVCPGGRGLPKILRYWWRRQNFPLRCCRGASGATSASRKVANAPCHERTMPASCQVRVPRCGGRWIFSSFSSSLRDELQSPQSQGEQSASRLSPQSKSQERSQKPAWLMKRLSGGAR